MSDLFDASPFGAPRAGVVDGSHRGEGLTAFLHPSTADVDTLDGAAPHPRSGIAWGMADPILRKRAPDDEPDEDEDEDDDLDEEDDDLDGDELDDDDDLDDEDEDDDLDEDDEDLDEDDDLDDDDLDDDLVDLDDEYDDTDEADRHRGGTEYEPD